MISIKLHKSFAGHAGETDGVSNTSSNINYGEIKCFDRQSNCRNQVGEEAARNSLPWASQDQLPKLVLSLRTSVRGSTTDASHAPQDMHKELISGMEAAEPSPRAVTLSHAFLMFDIARIHWCQMYLSKVLSSEAFNACIRPCRGYLHPSKHL